MEYSISEFLDVFVKKTPILVGHVYKDRITGEKIKILSVNRVVDIERYDAEVNENNSVAREKVREAIRNGFLEHDKNSCSVCRS